jgi:IMP cyclohydrolase
MYVGRLLVVAPGLAAYRVSSRSFPNRRIVDRDGTLTVGPTEDAPETDNPYVSYNCCRLVDADDDASGEAAGAGEPRAAIGNGSHVDPVAEKLAIGYPARDALVTALHALDYERDGYDTPRIAGVVGDESYVGVVRRDALLVERVDEPTLVATYERDAPEPFEFAATTAADAAREAYDLAFEHPVCAAAVERSAGGFETAHVNE